MSTIYYVDRSEAETAKRPEIVTLEQAQEASAAELMALPAKVLRQLQHDAQVQLDKAKTLKAGMDGAIALKYADLAENLRRQLGKTTGTLRFEDDHVPVISQLPKKVVWDQRKLAAVAEELRREGLIPAHFIEISYKISERDYTNLPASIRRKVDDARTISTGKPTFVLATENATTAGGEQ